MDNGHGLDVYTRGRGICLLYYPASIGSLEDAIELYRPDVIAVELDERRYRALRRQRPKAYAHGELLPPGELMATAIESAKQRGLRIAFIDRDSRVTFSRLWSISTLREKLSMLIHLGLALPGSGAKDQAIDRLLPEGEVSGIVEDLRTFAPAKAAVILDERDAYMARHLLDLSRTMRVLGIVGAGHRAGIHGHIESPDAIPAVDGRCEASGKRS